MFCPIFSDSFKSNSLGNDSRYNFYRISDLSCDNQNRLSYDSSIVWASEVQQFKRDFQSNLKPTFLVAISYNDVQRWIDQKLNAFRSTVSSIANSIVNSAKSALNATINAVSSTANNAYNKATQLASTISSSVSSALSQAKSYADSAVRVAKSGLDYAINAAKSTANSAYSKAVEVANSVGNKVTSAISTAKSYADSAVNTAKSALNTVINSVKSTANSAYNKAVEVANSVGSKVSSAISTAKSYADGLVKKYDNFISGINTTINNVVQPLLKPFNDFAKGINKTVMGIIDPVIKPFNDFIKSFNDKINGFLKPIIDKINNLPKDLLNQALQQAKDHFKDVLDNFKSGIDTIKATIDTILRNINDLLAFKKETNSRLSNLESRLNAVANTYVTKVEFTSFKTDVDNRIKLLNNAVSSINTDLKAAFQSFDLSLTDLSNKITSAISFVNFNISDLFISVNDKLNNIISLLTNLNSDSGPFAKILNLFENATLLSKLDNINNSVDNLAKKDIFDNAIFKGFEKFFAANKINDISDTLNKIHDFLLNSLLQILNTISDNVFFIRFFFDNTFNVLGKIEKIVNSISTKFDDLLKTVKEIELPKDENNMTINKEAETNIWDVAKEILKTLQEFIKNPTKILELIFSFIRSLIVPNSLESLENLKTNFDTNVNRKFSFVGQFKHNFIDIYNTPRTFDDITINGSGLFSGSFTIPLSLINIFAPYVKALANGFLVLAFLQSCYVWYHKKFKLESSD